MAWDPIEETELTPGYPVLKHMRQAWNSLKFLYGQIGTLAASGIPNGSFEGDSDGNGQPDNWTLNTYPGGSGSLVTDVPAHGATALKIVHPGGVGNGGGYYESDYCACSQVQKSVLSFIHWATAAGMHNMVQVRFFSKAKVFISTSVLYESSANPTTPTCFVTSFTPPANARYYKLDLVGGHSDTNVAGTAYFDGVGLAGIEALAARSTPITIASASIGGNAWADVGSANIQVPFCSIPVVLSLTASLSGSGTEFEDFQTAYQRFRVGTSYSNEVASPYPVLSNFLLPLQVGTQGLQTITVFMQLKAKNAGTAVGSVSDAAACCRINI